MIELLPVSAPRELDAVRTLFQEYSDQSDFMRCFQDFDNELAELPGAYAPPTGSLLLVRDGDEPAGCVALKDLGDGVCEMKRLYVRPTYRGQGIGRRLVERILAEARVLGYRRMRLDTLDSMHEARAMYQQFGFRPIAPYRHYPVTGVVFMELGLGQEA